MAEDKQPDGVDRSDGASQTGSEAPSDQPEGAKPSEETTGEAVGPIRTRIGQLSRRQKILRGSTLVVVFVIVLLVAVVPTGVLGLAITDSATFEAAPVAPDNATVSEAGYELQTADEVTVRQEISPAGQERSINVKNERRTYERTADVQNQSFNTGVFVTLSSPAISVAGAPQNPLADMSDRDLLKRFSGQLTNGSGDLNFERVGTRQATLLGSSTDVGEFRTTVSVSGEPQEVAVYVTRVRSQGDIIVAVGVHPTAFPGDRVSIFQMIYAVRHPAD